MRVSGPALGPSCEWRRAILCGVVFLCACGIQVRGQDVADAARQEKARKADEQKSPKHVYTEDDLKRSVILTPDDQARVEARKKLQNSVPAEQNAQQKPAETAPLTESLGEIARKYRQQKAAQDAELATKKKFTPFPYKSPDDTRLATPAPSAEPLAPVRSPLVPFRAVAPHVPSSTGNSLNRVSPFLPRPMHGEPNVPPAAMAVAPIAPPASAGSVRPVEKSLATTPVYSGMRRIEVQRGQSWWKLADLYLGSGARWRELRQLNSNAGGPPDLLRLGSVVVVPASAKAAGGSTAGTITVRRGDSFWSLAHEHLGRGSAWICVATANPQITDYTHIAIGTTLQLPGPDALRSCRATGNNETQR